jgi:hypothetical protein
VQVSPAPLSDPPERSPKTTRRRLEAHDPVPLPCPGPVPPVRLSSSLPAARRRPGAWSFRVWQLRASLVRTGDHRGLSGSWGTPMCLCPVLGPRRDWSVRPYDVCSMAPVTGKTKAPTIRRISGLDSRAWARAVYASSLGSPQDDARLASGCLASFPGGIGYSQGSNERFPVCFLHPVRRVERWRTHVRVRWQFHHFSKWASVDGSHSHVSSRPP